MLAAPLLPLRGIPAAGSGFCAEKIMRTSNKPLMELTASDLMTRDLVVLPREMSLRQAARLLLQSQISGAPVVDAAGKIAGVLSAMDFVRLSREPGAAARSAGDTLPATCSFQVKHRDPDGAVVTLCTLPPGVCSIQVEQRGPDGKTRTVCSEPHAVMADWQIVQVDDLPETAVGRCMTADPVTVGADVGICELARMMVDGHIHRLIVVDEQRRPVGIVSSTDILAAVAYAGRET